MLELKTHQDIDQLVWSCISESQNPLDFLDYIRHVRNRFAQQEQAFECAERYQGQTDAPRMFGQAVAALTELAGQGVHEFLTNGVPWPLVFFGRLNCSVRYRSVIFSS